MKCKIPEISWHNRDPVLSVDIQPKTGDTNSSTVYRLASGGTDAHVLIWYLNLNEHDIELDLAADLTRHQRAVNAVKWSPNGELLASGDDESVVFIWKQKAENEPVNIVDTTNEQDKEVWITLKVLRGHMEDIYDLCWSPNSQFLVSGSVDNSAMIWDVHKGKYTAMLTDHKGFVQGVTWDPKNQYIATLSTDRYLRIFDIQTKRVVHRINKSALPVPEGHQLHGHRMRLFHDDTLQTFFRRLCFTPDGKLLLTPAGVTDYEGATTPVNTTYVFSRYAFKQPAIVLPCPDQYTVAVRCCPLLFRLRPHNVERNPPAVPLPYRMIFAVATRSSVYFYDTQQRQPFGLISNIHYTRLTDITWSNDGRIVVVSSTDGFCSMITFEEGELGEIYEDSEVVLGAALINDLPLTNKKSKKQKENETQTQTQTITKTRKNSIEDTTTNLANGTNASAREPLLEKEVVETKIVNNKKSLTTAPTPIGIRRKNETKKESPTVQKDTMDSIEQQNQNAATQQKLTTALLPKPLLTDIIMDKEILSSDEKFESPEKKSRPVTPITVRRQPRTPSSTSATTSSIHQLGALNQSPLSTVVSINSPQQNVKRATPIAVRRKPRALTLTPSELVKTTFNAPIVVEEAMDAWPLAANKTEKAADKVLEQRIEVQTKNEVATKNLATQASTDPTCERTEDMRLVYEDTIEDSLPPKSNEEPIVPTATTTDTPGVQSTLDSPKEKPQTPSNKTPRRVPLRTISTPKSKKKLLD